MTPIVTLFITEQQWPSESVLRWKLKKENGRRSCTRLRTLVGDADVFRPFRIGRFLFTGTCLKWLRKTALYDSSGDLELLHPRRACLLHELITPAGSHQKPAIINDKHWANLFIPAHNPVLLLYWRLKEMLFSSRTLIYFSPPHHHHPPKKKKSRLAHMKDLAGGHE